MEFIQKCHSVFNGSEVYDEAIIKHVLSMAMTVENIQVIQRLLPKANDNSCFHVFRWAIARGQVPIVQQLLLRIDPRIRGDQLLTVAVAHNQPEIVRILLQDARADPGTRDGFLVKIAVFHRYHQIFVLLKEAIGDINKFFSQ